MANCAPGQSGGALEGLDFRVEAGQTMTQVLFFKFTTQSAKLRQRRVVLELSRDAIDKHGQAVRDKVSQITANNIAAFKISLTP